MRPGRGYTVRPAGASRSSLVLTQVLGAPTPRMVYIESFARVRSLSLSARILRHVVDRFVVQWPTADPHAACFDVLV